MEIAARLDRLRQAFAGCGVVAFGDLSTGLVLCVSAERKPPQERLDRLCRSAQNLLTGPATAGAEIALGLPRGSGGERAIAVNGDTVEVFLRSPTVPTDALCCICAPNVEIEALIEHGRAELSAIGSA